MQSATRLMLSPLANRTYRHLFAAQTLSLLGSGLTTVALGLLAYDLAGADAGTVLGTALALKMIAYVGLAPLAGAVAERLPRRGLLVALDLARAVLVGLLPFVSEIWQVFALVFLFQACAAAFTPVFQATIPDVLEDERHYASALSLSRLAYDLEALASPILAGLLLTVLGFHWLFVGNALGFVASALLVVSVALPARSASREARGFFARATRGAWIFLATPRLRGLLALNLTVAAAGAMVIVNTVVLVREDLGGSDRDVAILFSAYGLGSIAAALGLPRLLRRSSERSIMLAGAGLLVAGLASAYFGLTAATALLVWLILGAGAALVQTPAGLLLRRSCHAADRPCLFAAQFSLFHACWLAIYPAAGWLGAGLGLEATFALMALAGGAGIVAAAIVWPRHDPSTVWHEHGAIEHAHGEHDHLHHSPGAIEPVGGSLERHRHRPVRHVHAFVIDDHHPSWPRPS